MHTAQLPVTTFNNPLIRFIADDRYRWLRHTLFILLCFILGFKGDVGNYHQQQPLKYQRAVIIIDAWTTISVMIMIYFLILFLIPRLLFRSRVFLFAICFFVMVSLIYFIVWYVDMVYLLPLDTAELKRQHTELSFIAYIQYCGIASILLGSVVGLAVFKKWINDTQQMNELYQAKLTAELEQLKSQVNPHFLFNTLNNLFVLTKTDPEKASQVILGLSDLLRYQLYDSAKEKIILSKDIDFLRNLLALEKLRKHDFEFSIQTEGRTDGVMLSPFLFIPFVENAIKHGASATGHSYLYLHFKLTPTHLHFRSENSVPAARKNLVGGLGLRNIKRRLELLYPDNYSLEVKEETNKYIVNLIIPL